MYWLSNRNKYKNPKKINLDNLLNYATAQVRHWKSTSEFMECPRYIEEQSIWRLEQIKEKSPACFEDGKCINCGCDIVEKSFETKADDCYPELMGKEVWEKYKIDNKITVYA